MIDAPSDPKKAYGTTRSRRASVSYGEVERAATALLKAGKRPTIEGVREVLKGGAPDTITQALTRYWQDLGSRIEGDSASLSRLPAEVADLAESIWQRALSLAADAAAQRAGAVREGLEFFKRENELKAHSLSLREKELDAQLRARERTIQELERHLRTAMGFVQQRDETIRSLQSRLDATERELEAAKTRFTKLIARTTPRSRGSAKPRQMRPKPSRTGKRLPKKTPTRRRKRR